MKKLFLCLAFLFSLSEMNAQEKQVYCEIVGTSASLLGKEVTVSIDFGQDRKLFKSQALVDELGAPIVFNSMIDALNWMGQLGWEFAQAYVVTTDSPKQNVYHYLLTKKLKEGEAIDAGIRTKESVDSPDEGKKVELAQKEENMAYVALLMKTNRLNSKYKEEISKLFPFNSMSVLIQSKTEEELRTMSKKHSKYFDRYEIFE